MKVATLVIILGLAAVAYASQDAGTSHSTVLETFLLHRRLIDTQYSRVQYSRIQLFVVCLSLLAYPCICRVLLHSSSFPYHFAVSVVPDLATLELKFGSFEGFVRGKTDDRVKGWFDTVDGVFDDTAAAWRRATRCTKNLADNAAMLVYGDATHAKAMSHFANQKGQLKHSYFTSKAPSPKKAPFDPVKEEAESKSRNLKTFSNKLEMCFTIQMEIAREAIRAAKARMRADPMRPETFLAADHSATAEDQIIKGFNDMRTAALEVLKKAIDDAAGRAVSLTFPDTPSTAFLNPSMNVNPQAYCGSHRACMNGGKCLAFGRCACPTDWTGPRCTEPLQTCAVYNVACENYGQCAGANGQWTCTCPMGYTGLYCERYNSAQTPMAMAAAQSASARAEDMAKQAAEQAKNDAKVMEQAQNIADAEAAAIADILSVLPPQAHPLIPQPSSRRLIRVANQLAAAARVAKKFRSESQVYPTNIPPTPTPLNTPTLTQVQFANLPSTTPSPILAPPTAPAPAQSASFTGFVETGSSSLVEAEAVDSLSASMAQVVDNQYNHQQQQQQQGAANTQGMFFEPTYM